MFSAFSEEGRKMKLSLMPLGVEHMATSALNGFELDDEIIFDAIRR